MRIENLRTERKGEKERAAATVSWEQSDRQAQDIYFEVDSEFADDFSCNPHSFLLPSAMAALRYGEERVYLDGEVCPELREGLMMVLELFRHWYGWYGPERKPLKIEAITRSRPANTQRPERAGLLFSGGIDSIAALRANRLAYPLEYPGSVKDGLLVRGMEVHDEKGFQHLLDSVSVLAKEAGITLIPVSTNIRILGPEDNEEFYDFWINEFEGAAFSSIAHSMSKRLSTVYVSSTYDIPNIMPHASHPMVEPNYSSADMRIRLVGVTMSRFEKTGLVAQWSPALENLRVCNRAKNNPQPGVLNCSRCEKCVQTMLALLALGVLDKSTAFSRDDLTAEQVLAVGSSTFTEHQFYAELVQPLSEMGRQDLVNAVKQIMARYRHSRWKKKLSDRTIEPVKEIDRKYLNDSLRRLKRLVHSRTVSSN